MLCCEAVFGFSEGQEYIHTKYICVNASMSILSMFGDPPRRLSPIPMMSVHYRFIRPPVVLSGVTRWPCLDVIDSPTIPGQKTVVATVDIAPGLLIPYTGKILTIEDDEGLVYASSAGNDETKVVDADPKLPECENNACIAGRLNEASFGQHYNCVLVELDDTEYLELNAPEYKNFDRAVCPFLLVAVPVKRGQELLWHYGQRYTRDYEALDFNLERKVYNSIDNGLFRRVYEGFEALKKHKIELDTDSNIAMNDT